MFFLKPRILILKKLNMSNSWTNSWDQAITEAIKNSSSLSKEEIEEILLEREQVQRLVNPPTQAYAHRL